MLQHTGVAVEASRHFFRPAHRNLPVFKNRDVVQWIEAERLTRNKEEPTDCSGLRFQILLQGRTPRKMKLWNVLGKVAGTHHK
jgi:hypothetical protein